MASFHRLNYQNSHIAVFNRRIIAKDLLHKILNRFIHHFRCCDLPSLLWQPERVVPHLVVLPSQYSLRVKLSNRVETEMFRKRAQMNPQCLAESHTSQCTPLVTSTGLACKYNGLRCIYRASFCESAASEWQGRAIWLYASLQQRMAR